MDSSLVLRGVRRCSFPRFLGWLAPWTVLLALGVFAAGLCLIRGLNQTNMDNRFAFGLWIFMDLAIIALGAGAFFTGFLLYVMRRTELKAVINSAVVIGFVCYSGAVAALAIDVGQPIRAWFTFWYPNAHSMLTEVTFCITCYLIVLTIEYLPVVLKNRQLRKVPSYLVLEFQLHKVMAVFAGVGTFLSFFHQGSLGGLFGVLQGRPFAFREGFAIWPSTFFLFLLSAAAAGPSFVLLTTRLVESVSRKRLVPDHVFTRLAKVSGWMMIVYVLLKSVDTLVWLNRTSPSLGFPAHRFYNASPGGAWTLLVEIVLLGLLPAIVLITPGLRARRGWMPGAAGAVCAGIALNRYIFTIKTLAMPTLAWDRFLSYVPSWQEMAVAAGIIAYGVLVYSISFRYLPLFPQERDLAGGASRS